MRERDGLRAGRELRQDEDRRLDPRGAEPEPFLDQRDAGPRGAGLDRGSGHLHVAVAVAVRLHHRHQLGGLGLEDAGVVADRVQIDLDPGGPIPLGHSPSTCATASGTRSSTSPATRSFAEVPAREEPGQPVEVGGGGGRLRRRDPPREEPADHPGEDVAGPGRREGRRSGHVDEQPPARLGDHGSTPFQEGDGARLLRQRPDVRGAVGVEVARLHAGEPRELADVRREDGLGLTVLQRRAVAGERVQAVRVEDERDGRAPHRVADERHRLPRSS